MQFKGEKKSVRFSRQDFDHYINWLIADKKLRYSRTRIAENFARQYLTTPTPPKAYQLCRYIFKVWASQSGNRVFGNLEKRNNDLSRSLHEAFLNVISHTKMNELNIEMKCVAELNKIKGLSTSYSSKLLRFLYPNKFATLDSILRNALGYGEKPRSYQDFINELKSFKKLNNLKQSISEIEVVLFCICSSRMATGPEVLSSEYIDFDHNTTQ